MERFVVETDENTKKHVIKKAKFFIKERIRKRGEEFEIYMPNGMFIVNTKDWTVKRRVD